MIPSIPPPEVPADRKPGTPRKRRLVISLAQPGGDKRWMDSVDFDQQVQWKVGEFVREDADRVLIVGVPSWPEPQADKVWAERLAECKRWWISVKGTAKSSAVVWISRRMDLTTLALCQDLDLPMYAGGVSGPGEEMGDCVWLCNWAPEKHFCGNIFCGQEIPADVRYKQCLGCKQVRFCERRDCAKLGMALHRPCCSEDPEMESKSYFLDQFYCVEGADDFASLEEYDMRIFGEEYFEAFCPMLSPDPDTELQQHQQQQQAAKKKPRSRKKPSRSKAAIAERAAAKAAALAALQQQQSPPPTPLLAPTPEPSF